MRMQNDIVITRYALKTIIDTKSNERFGFSTPNKPEQMECSKIGLYCCTVRINNDLY